MASEGLDALAKDVLESSFALIADVSRTDYIGVFTKCTDIIVLALLTLSH